MKKLIVGLAALTCVPAVATTICAEEDVVAIVLDPTVNGAVHSCNADLFEWSATFGYGTVWGIATCMDVSGTTANPVEDLRSEDGELAVGGERKGVYCWCKMTHPASSAWVFRNTYASLSDCRSNCASNCGYYVRFYSSFRGPLFGSLGT